MSEAKFDLLLEELSELFQTPLERDVKNACRIVVDEKLVIQMELDEPKEHLMLGSVICTIPAGKFRENVLKEALKENNQPPPLHGVLSYVEKNNTLVLYEYHLISELKAAQLAEFLEAMMEKALVWYEAIDKGQPSPNPSEVVVDKPPPPQYGVRL